MTDLVKRSVSIAGHATSVSLETPFWDELRAIARAEGLTLAGLIARVDAGRAGRNLSSELRVFVLERVRERAGADRPEPR
jgi:predicted DNA-binding ribbon-helix-helix protein